MKRHLSFSHYGSFDKLMPSEKRFALHHARWLLGRFPNSAGGLWASNNAEWAREWIRRYEHLTDY